MKENFLKLKELTEETKNDLIKMLCISVKNGSTHINYSRTVDVADKAYAYTSGDGIDNYMKQFNRRETDEMFTQRKIITQHIIPAAIQNLIFILWKVPRSSAVIMNYSNPSNQNNKQKLKDTEENYFAKQNVFSYLNKKQVLFDSMDPNQWSINEFTSTDGSELSEVYPFNVASKDALDFEYINGQLNYLLIRNGVTSSGPDDSGRTISLTLYKYTLYTPNINISLVPIINVKVLSTFAEMQIKEVDGVQVIRINNILYKIDVPIPHNIGFVQARRVGYRPDNQTNGETFVPFWWPAECYLTKMITAVSEMDLNMKLHAYPQKWQYMKKCKNLNCNKGYTPQGGLCPTCKGEGWDIHTTAQDIILLSLPDNKDELIDLKTLVNYVYPPVDGLEFENKYILQLFSQAKESIYNTQVYNKVAFEQTATGKEIDMESIYDTIYSYAENFVDSWKFKIECIARIIDADNGLIIVAVVQMDFKLKSKMVLVTERGKAKEAGASEVILSSFDNDIIDIIYREQPSEKRKIMVKEMFNPLSGKSELERIAIRASGILPEEKKIFYDNSGWIFIEIENEYPNFYDLAYSEQKKIIDEKINKIKSSINEGAVQYNPDLNK